MSANANAPALPEITDRLQKVTAHVTAAQGLVGKGDAVNLEGLDNVVNDLCKDIQDLPEDDQDACREPLITLIDEFDRLTSALEEQRDALQVELKGLGERERAASAYGGAPGAAPGKTK